MLESKMVIHPKYLPTKFPFWPTVILWMVVERFDWNPYMVGVAGVWTAVSILGSLLLIASETKVPPSKVV